MRPRTEGWDKWVRALKTGDLVTVRYAHTDRTIFHVRVRVTKTGRVLLANHGRDRRDWSRGVVSLPGGGERYISPAPNGAEEGIA